MILLSLLLAAATPATPISADRIKADVRTLSSDAFGGRGPGEPGEAKTIAFLAKSFADAGLQPGGADGGWYQDVPLVRMDRLPGATMSLKIGGKTVPLVPGRDASLGLRNEGRTTVVGAPLVFAGYGVVDTAKGWDSYKGIDMTGKVAVILANDPDFEAGKDLGFEGRRMSYAGRTSIKVATALAAGAVGVLTIHEDAAASYPFMQVASGDALPTMAFAPLAPSSMKLSGWLRRDIGIDLLRHSGLDFEAMKRAARDPAFRAIPLKDSTVSADASLKVTPFTSHNVVAKLPGATRPGEYVLYGAHWDANGTNGPDASGDAIRNGAIDNATGTAELLEVARAFARGKAPARTVIFAAWTAEEKGLVGAEYFAAHPIYPLARTAAVINLDPHVVLPAARNIELVGVGRTPLEADVVRAAATLGLRVHPEPNPEAGWYFRSDHFPFAKKGVPALQFRAGRDLVEGGLAAGEPLVAAYNTRRYHQPNDQFDPAWTFAGTAQEASVAYVLGREIAESSAWPTWTDGNEFKAIRDASAAERR